MKGKNSKYIADRIQVPLSTIQRRVRKLFESELIETTINLNYEKLGYKRGFLHIYLKNGLADKIGRLVGEMDGVLSVSVHIGNSDLVALFIYKDSKQLLDMISDAKKIDGVDKVLWSEEVYFIKIGDSKMNILTK